MWEMCGISTGDLFTILQNVWQPTPWVQHINRAKTTAWIQKHPGAYTFPGMISHCLQDAHE
jgi:hypothetical protein